MCFIAPDRHEPHRYWVVRDSDSRLYHEVYDDQNEGEEGDLSQLEPDAFADQCHDLSSSGSEDSGSSSDSGSDGDSEGSDDLRDVESSLTREMQRDRDMLWE